MFAAPAGAQVEPLVVPVTPTSTPTPVTVTRRLSIGAVGDVLMHKPVKDAAANNSFEWLFEPIADLMWQPDLMFANLETPIAPRTGKPGIAFQFNAPPASLKALQKSGVDVLSVANNHAFDQGRRGMLETMQHLEEAGLPYIGAGVSPHEAGPRFMTRGGIKVAMLAWAEKFNQSGGNACKTPCVRVAELDLATAKTQIEAAAKRADAVIVSLHWGEEYRSAPEDEQIETAHALADAGALVILGHHPHVLQPLELYTRKDGRVAIIAYSLGNFISNQSAKFVHGVAPDDGGDTRDSALLRVEIVERDYGKGVKRIELGRVDFVPLWTHNNRVELKNKKERKEKITIRVVAVDRELDAVQAELKKLPTPLPDDKKAAYLELRRREALYVRRKRIIAERMGREFLRKKEPDPPAIKTGE